ncbi:MAG: Co2+/Mg2+ efflux protein ApaG [Flavobacteriales bacterium]|nr:Co2+/Mg2+ efflux protein ApaG [Flavobacteriales bacterium]
MSTTVTQDIRVTARSRYEAVHSDPKVGRFLFSYRITIANHGKDTVRLKSRHWIIRDSLAPTREVAGPGVVGETPVLRPGEEFTYSSACDLRSGLGSMAGTYCMHRISDDHEFDVVIPEIQLRFPYTAN